MNKFREIQAPEPPPAREEKVSPLVGGIVLDRSPQHISLHESPDVSGVRVEKGALRQDYGLTALSSAPATKIIALGEHRFVLSASTLNSKVFRVYRNGSNFPQVDSLSGTTWGSEATGAFTILEVLLGWKSYFDAVFFADGAKIFKWDRSPTITSQSDDFGALNNLDLEGETTPLTLAPGDSWDGKYKANYKVTITGPSLDAGEVKVDLLKGTELIETKSYLVPASNDTARSLSFLTENFEFIHGNLPNGTVLTLRLTSRTGSPIVNTDHLVGTGGTPDWSGSKARAREAKGDIYRFIFSIHDDGLGGYANVEFYVNDSGAGWTVIETVPFPTGYFHVYYLHMDGLGSGSSFGLNLAAGTPVGWVILDGRVEWEEVYDVSVHGFVNAEDGTPGIQYETFGAAVNQVTQVADEASTNLIGRFIGVFDRRIWLLRAEGDPQNVQYCADGNVRKWLVDGSAIVSLEGEGDPIDELMALEEIGPNIGALFRARSIMRVIPTGDIDPEYIFAPWITELGTESPFSVCRTPYGIIFVGSDRQVYLLTESGLRPIGYPWNRELDVSSIDLSKIQGTYDEVANSYLLSVIITEV